MSLHDRNDDDPKPQPIRRPPNPRLPQPVRSYAEAESLRLRLARARLDRSSPRA